MEGFCGSMCAPAGGGGSFGGGLSMYSHEAMKTTMVPGSTRNDSCVPNRIGDT